MTPGNLLKVIPADLLDTVNFYDTVCLLAVHTHCSCCCTALLMLLTADVSTW